LGLFERVGAQVDYTFVKDRGDLRDDRLYYLYFREKPDKNLTYNPGGGVDNLEETKGGAGKAAVSC
jgi:hypothetical protein